MTFEGVCWDEWGFFVVAVGFFAVVVTEGEGASSSEIGSSCSDPQPVKRVERSKKSAKKKIKNRFIPKYPFLSLYTNYTKYSSSCQRLFPCLWGDFTKF